MSSNQAASVKVDHTVRLPDEMLCSIISYIPSLADKFKLAAVNKKFRRCVMSELNKPMPLNINFHNGTLNGENVPIHQWPQALQALAPKTCFTQISIVGPRKPDKLIERFKQFIHKWLHYERSIDQLLYPLAVSACLDQVRVFELLDLPGFTYDPSLLAKVLTQCHKLSIFRLDFQSRPLSSATAPPAVRALDVSSIVANKPLTHLKLKLYDYNQNQLNNLFESLPRTLQSLFLSFTHMQCPNFVDLVNNSGAVWSGLRDMRLLYGPDIAVPHLDIIFGTVLARLPLLQNYVIGCGDGISSQEIVTGVMALFNNSKRQQPTVVKHFVYDSRTMNRVGGMYGCRAVTLSSQLKRFHPNVQIDFDDENVRFMLNSVTWVTAIAEEPHPDQCLKCRRVYTVVVHQLAKQAEERRSSHLANYRLDRCKVDRIVMDLNVKRHQGQVAQWALINEAGDLVAVTFEDEDGDQFYITIDCVRCLNENCIGCVLV